MDIPLERGEAAIDVIHNMFLLVDGYFLGCVPLKYPNGLFSVGSSGGPKGLFGAGIGAGVAAVITGIASGSVTVAAEVLSATPGEDPGPEWETVAEEPFEATVGELVVQGVESAPPEELPVLTPDGPGDYRVRVCARNRDVDYLARPSTESYLIQVWPSPPAPGRSIRIGDDVGRSLSRTSTNDR